MYHSPSFLRTMDRTPLFDWWTKNQGSQKGIRNGKLQKENFKQKYDTITDTCTGYYQSYKMTELWCNILLHNYSTSTWYSMLFKLTNPASEANTFSLSFHNFHVLLLLTSATGKFPFKTGQVAHGVNIHNFNTNETFFTQTFFIAQLK